MKKQNNPIIVKVTELNTGKPVTGLKEEDFEIIKINNKISINEILGVYKKVHISEGKIYDENKNEIKEIYGESPIKKVMSTLLLIKAAEESLKEFRSGLNIINDKVIIMSDNDELKFVDINTGNKDE